MKCLVAYKYEDENGKDRYIQLCDTEFENKEAAKEYIDKYVRNGDFRILGKNTQ